MRTNDYFSSLFDLMRTCQRETKIEFLSKFGMVLNVVVLREIKKNWLMMTILPNAKFEHSEPRSKCAPLLVRRRIPLSSGVISAVPLLRQHFLRVAK